MSTGNSGNKGTVVDYMAADSGDDTEDLNADDTPEPGRDTLDEWIAGGSYFGTIDMTQYTPLVTCRDDFYKGAWLVLQAIGGTVFLRRGVKPNDFLEDGDVVIELSQQLNLRLLLDWANRGFILLQDGQCFNVIDVESRPGKILLSIETVNRLDDDDDD